MTVKLIDAPVKRLREMVAECATFQSVVGAANRTAALLSVHIPYVSGDDVLGDMPRAVINPSEGSNSAEKIGINNFSSEGNALLTFEFRVPLSVTSASKVGEAGKDAYDWFGDKIDLIIDEMLALAGTGVSFAGETHLNLQSVDKVDGPVEYEPEEVDRDSEDVAVASYEWFIGFQVAWR